MLIPLHAQLGIAHRGCTENAEENTLAAIAAGWEGRADRVEVDVRFLADHSLVLFHDKEVAGVDVGTLTLQQLRELSPGLDIPLLTEAFAATAPENILLLDLKDPTPGFTARILPLIQQELANNRKLILQSTDLDALKLLREKLPENIPLFYVTALDRGGPLIQPPDPKRLAEELADAGLNGITAKGRNFVDAAYVNAFKAKGLTYYVWTINEAERMRYYSSIGVDGIITDRLRLLKKTLDARSK